ncbi:YhdP family protein [Niveibacterium umoris]|uniref:Uncharacterized protein (TIGR02099 family) n=2 Tax=Niveibacterium umoris TaxID=1193620 RepID=A0A840BII0_9RHOO|nr:YhdP family protein [Niveibacterium umoris]MBB4012443.1 uncharacterized protein (TIGR02099 family) [Niveibacterium umoris]
MLPSYFRFQLSRLAPAGPRTQWVRLVFRLAVAAYFVAGLGLLAARYLVLPHAGEWRPEVERQVSRVIGLPVAIAHLDADWDGLRPRLRLRGVTLHDASGHPALRLAAVDASLSWRSIVAGAIRLRRLTIDRPELTLLRRPDGRVELSGFPAGSGDAADLKWVFEQPAIVIRNARLTWIDSQRGADPLVLEQLNLRLENSDNSHRFGITAVPPRTLASPIDLRGRLDGDASLTPTRWSGEIFASVDRADLARSAQWVDWPVHVAAAVGGLRLWVSVADGQPVAAAADLAFRDVSVTLARDVLPLELKRLAGHVEGSQRGGTLKLLARQLAVQTGEGRAVRPVSFSIEHIAGRDKREAQGKFTGRQLDVPALAALARHLPLPQGWAQRLAAFAPQGVFEQMDLSWRGEDGVPATYHAAARFSGLGAAPQGLLPGGQGWAGTVDLDERGGRFDLRVNKGSIALPAVFEDGEIPIDQAEFAGDWELRGGEASVRLKQGRFSNADAAGSASGVWHSRGDGPGVIDLEARLGHAQGRAVWRYMPLVVAADVRHWLRDAISEGVADDAKLVLKGDLARFPFVGDPSGAFTVDARVKGVRLMYAPDWPAIDAIEGTLKFDRARMEIHADRGAVFDAKVSQVHAVIPDLDHGMLALEGRAAGPTREFLRFVNASPIGNKFGYFTRGVEAVGDGALKLHLAVPLADAAKTTTSGEFQFTNNRLRLLPRFPLLESANGRFAFTESRFAIPDASGIFMGTPVRVRGDTRRDGAVDIEARGSVAMRQLALQFPSPLWDHLAGETPVTAHVVAREHDVSLGLESSLLGVASSLPDPFNKSAGQAQPMKLDWRWFNGGPLTRQSVEGSLPGRARVRLDLNEAADGAHVTQGVLALGDADTALPARGLALRARLGRLDLDAWASALGHAGTDEGAPPFDSLDVQAGDLVLKGLRFHDQGLVAQRDGSLWNGQLKGPAAAGELSIDTRGAGRINARLSRLALLPVTRVRERVLAERNAQGVVRMPQIDVRVASFAHSARELGALSLHGAPDGDDWLLDQLTLSNDDGKISMSGAYLFGRTRLRFELDARDAGALLGRLGHAGLLRRGEVNAKGSLDWKGPPEAPDLASLSGQFELKVEAGQFSKFEPGMGRLLGVFSLQSLPRRATLDFRDIFSEGFAFDTVSGSMKISAGVLRTDDLAIRGPAARVRMQGSVDLAAETQQLTVQVQPTLSETVALGAALGPAIGTLNPAVGLVAFLAQKVLSDPIEHMFSYEYAVDGSWAEPRVRKLSGAPARAQPNRSEP